MSTLTHSSSNSSATSNANNNVNNNNNNNLIITSASPAAPSSTSVANSNTLNNNNNSSFNATPGTPVFPVAAVHSGLASSAKRLLPFTRNMSTTTAPASTSSGAAAAAGQQQLSNSVAPPSSGVSSMATVSNCPTTAAGIIPPELNVVLHGYHRKLKKNKKKYFVVYGDTPEKSARLEYFDSEKKFKQSWLKSSSGSQAKRSIVLRSCFNINKRNDTGKKHVIALYTKDDCFFIVFDSEEELNRWLRTLLSLQRGEDSEDDPPRPTFEHVWDVVVQRKGLGESYGIIGNYRLCITDKTLSLVRIGNATVSGDNRVEMVEFPLASLRRYGGAQRYLYLEVGRSTTTGAGEIWIQAQDNIIASNMLATIMKTAKNKEAADTLGPIQRNRSSSANAAYKPTQMPMRRSTHTGQKPINCSPSGGGAGGEDQSSPHASYAQSSESSSSATSTNTVVAVQQNPNCSPNSKRNSEKQSTTTTTSSPASASHSSSTASSVGGPPGNSSQSHSHSHHRIPHHPFPSSTVSCKNSIKKPKLDPPKEEESGSSYSYSTLLNPGQNSPSPGVVISLQVPPTPPAKLQPQKMAMAAHHHEPTNTAGDTSSSSPMSAISSDTVEICSPNDHAVTPAVIFHQRALSLPSATPMLSHSPHTSNCPPPPPPTTTTTPPSIIVIGNNSAAIGASSGGSGGSSGNSNNLGTTGGHYQLQQQFHQNQQNSQGSAAANNQSNFFGGRIQTVHHRTRSLPLSEESAIRITSGGQIGLSLANQHHHPHHQQQQQQQGSTAIRKHRQSFSLSIASLRCTCPSSTTTTMANRYNLCPLHGASASPSANNNLPAVNPNQQDYENMNKSCSYLTLSTSPPAALSMTTGSISNQQQHYYSNHSFDSTATGGSDNGINNINNMITGTTTTPSRSSMESIIEDQKYLPMDMKKPPHQAPPSQEDPTPSPNLQFISRLLRSSNLQSINSSKLAALKLATAGSTANNSSSTSSSSNSSNSSTSTGNTHGSTSTNNTASSTANITAASNHLVVDSPPATLQRRSTGTSGRKTQVHSSRRSAVIARERCDSLPSRNRTSSETSTGGQQNANASGTMPPPKTIPSASFQRPLSMIVGGHHRVQSHSHSPPVHSSPLSPPSTGACSTCSDGSSLSIDETDYGGSGTTPEEGNLFPKVINPFQSGSGGSIPEENSEEYIHNYPQVHNYQSSQHQMLHQHQHRSIDEFSSHTMAAGRRGSPAPASASVNIVGSSDQTGGGSSTSNYMGMYSPGSSSPGDPSGNGGYIPMSPITDFPRGLYTGSSSAHSRASSLAEDTVDGYVPMAARAHNEEYVDMEPSHASSSSRTTSTTTATHPAGGASGMTGGGNGNISSAASSCSITSGTPSTDMRFSEYHLEKVVARFTPSEDDEMDRPLRTYSVGSRLEHNKRKLRVDMLSSEGASNSRARAFSVGSRAKVPRSELYKSGAAPITAPLLSTGSSGSIQESNSNSGSTVGINMMAAGASGISDSGCSKKSSSAPMLAPKQHGSVDHMEDLMEIDYGVPFHAESSTPQKGGGMEDYMIMTPGGVPDPNSGYVEMKPGHNAHSLNATNAVQEESDYLVMLPGMAPELNLSTKSTSSPIDISSPKKFNSSAGGLSKSNNNNNNYIDMSPRMNQGASHHTSSSSAAHRKSRVPSEDYLNITPLMMTSSGGCGGDSGNEDKMTHEDDELAAPSSAPEGYMEMSWNQNKSSLKPDSAKPAASDEYINMDFTRKEINRVDSRLSSQPIAIQQSSSGRNVPGDDAMEPKIGGAPSNIPNYLPLHSSAAGQQRGAPQIGFSPKQHGIRARCDSRDSGIVTPSGSQATIFPFSPGSPIKSFMVNSSSEASAEERKCFVDGTTGSLRISEIDEENSEESTEFLMMDPQQKPQTSSNDQESNKLEDLSHNYAELSIGQQQQQKPETSHTSSFSSSKRANLSLILTTSTNTRTTPTVTTMKSTVEYPNYVNCSPVTTPVTPKPQTPMTIDDQAGDYAIMNPASQRKLSSTSQSELSTVETAGLPPLTRKSYQIGFKPITSSQDEALLKKCAGASPKAAFHRQYSERRTGAATDASGYELLQRTSRPNSVNSEKISGSKCSTSAGSTRPNSANSDRLPIISATSSSASSTSTLCESKNHSPTASSTMIAATTGSSITTIPNNTASSSSTRPESVSSLTDPHIISRPPSVSSERELHYASLDLPPCSSSKMEVDCSSAQEQPSPAGPRSTGTSGGSDSLNSSPSPNSGCTSQQPTAGSAFTYAQIDFVRTFPQGAAATTTATQQPSAGTKSGGGQP
ncbi:mucin-19 isoform X2 [Uranotaenia lowii]|uniref:mucin-19 isoform X2 n=1 Tax=Uranotaenia lowii TaxID=190385 RepID=UPI002478CD6B|nr:mucin-19 isoform X2 [Uranotaenia lowii]